MHLPLESQQDSRGLAAPFAALQQNRPHGRVSLLDSGRGADNTFGFTTDSAEEAPAPDVVSVAASGSASRPVGFPWVRRGVFVLAGRGVFSPGIAGRVALIAHRLLSAAQTETAKFDSDGRGMRGSAAGVAGVRNGGVWNTPGNWFCVTGGTPLFQRLQTPPFLVRADAGASRIGI
jgi:hypothetical protein